MKILHVINSLHVGGAQKMVYDFALLQWQNGHDVSVLSLMQSDSYLEKDLIEHGIKINFIYSASSSLKKIYSPLTILKLGRYLKWADVIHVHLFPANYWCAFYKALFCHRLKLLTTEHNTNNRRRDKPYLKPIERFVYRRYNAVVACSEKAQLSLNAFLGCKMAQFISNGIAIDTYHEAEPYTFQEAYGTNEIQSIVTMVARIDPPKDQATLIRALTYLPANVHAAFVGDGGHKTECEALAKKLGVADRCHFLGMRSDVPRLVKTSDINILSSKWEGLSLSSVECMATAHPFIGANVQGIKEVVAGAGLLFDYGDDKGLASCINDLLNSKELYADVSAKCYERAKDYDILKTYNAYLNCYINL